MFSKKAVIFIAYNGSQVYLVADLNSQNFKYRTNEK
jgi:hypothetical protein